MALIPEEKIAEIRDRTDIVQVVGEYVTLRRTGVNHKGLCPFHQEKSPSFNVNAQKQFFHCFGCGKSGDVFSFVTEVEGKSFVDVARELARKAGVDLPEPERSREAVERAQRAESERARMVRLNDVVATWYRAQLATPVGARAQAYIDQRGIGAEVAEKFRIGYAPSGWDALTRFLESKKVPAELAERAGLIRRRESAAPGVAGTPPSKTTHFDVFVDRVVYALTSPMGEVIGFGGRVLEAPSGSDGQPKYKNSPETLVYKKGENLFGLHLAKHAIRKGGRALVVEGNFDVMTLHQQGLDYAVAPQGTAITDAQVSLLKRFAREVLLMLDADAAGRAATLKVVHLFAAAEVKARIVALRSANGKKVDPDDLARNDLPRLQQLIDQAQDAVEFFFDQVAGSAAPSVPGRVAAIEECVPLLRAIRYSLARDLYVDRLAQLLKVDVGLIRRTLRGQAAPPSRPAAAPPERTESFSEPVDPNEAPGPVVDPVVEPRPLAAPHAKLLAFLGQHATLFARMPPDVVSQIGDPDVRRLLELAVTRGRFDPQAALAEAAPAIRDEVARALLSDEFATDDEKLKQRLLAEIVAELALPEDRGALEAERNAAAASGDTERFKKLNARIRSMRHRTHGHV